MKTKLPSYCNEKFLAFLWKHQLIDWENTKVLFCNSLEIIYCGQENPNSGPDFLNARVKIDHVLWVGNIELHVRSSDWNVHSHQTDEAFNNVLFQVVFTHDREIKSSDSKVIPSLELKWKKNLHDYMQEFLIPGKFIPCANNIINVREITISNWLEALSVERLEEKTRKINERLLHNRGDWKQTLYEYIARNFGFNINSQPFEMLARILPYTLIQRHRLEKFQVEAMIFGISGFLNSNFLDDLYSNRLKKEYLYLKKKYSLKEFESHIWKFLRTRPANFPTIRLAQFASFVINHPDIFDLVTESKDAITIYRFFSVETSQYWKEHYDFLKKNAKKSKCTLSHSSIDLIIINTIIPFKFAYAHQNNNIRLKLDAFNLFESMKAEKNAIISNWKNYNVKVKNAMDSQGLLQLKHNYCDNVRCLDCQIGVELMINQ